MITSVVVDNLSKQFHDLPDIGLAYIYFNYNAHKHQRLQDVLSSIFKQLCQNMKVLPEILSKLHEKHAAQLTQPSPEELENALIETSKSLSRVFIVLDGLDECQATLDCHTRLLSCLYNLQTKTQASILITSRPTSEVEIIFSGCLKQEIKAKASDVDKYVESRLPKVLGSGLETANLGAMIKSKVMGIVDGMFLLAQLYMDSLQDATSAAEVREALDEIEIQPSQNTEDGSYTPMLFKAYDKVMARISGQQPRSRNLAMKTLSWVVHAKRLLTTAELQHALAVRDTDTALDFQNVREIDMILSVCAGLITVGENSDCVRLAHETTQKYLESTAAKYFPNAQSEITSTCTAYLTFHGFDVLPVQSRLLRMTTERPLFPYAATYWGHHAREAGQCVSDSVNKLLRCNVSVQIACSKISSENDILNPNTTWNPLHLAAFFGLSRHVEALIDDGLDPKRVGDRNISPLMVASANGFEEVVNLLLNKGADIQAKCSGQRTALIFASLFGHGAIVRKLLVKGADVTAGPYTDMLAFDPASVPGYWDVVSLLAEALLKAGSTGSHGRYLMRLDGGIDRMTRMLLRWGAHMRHPPSMMASGSAPLDPTLGK
ncbi:GA-binding protein subunit beta-2 [Colletotrichum fructicola]|nr:GA-binding protein subunit beta-2 [Colletotrichum fructicola]KAF4939551.1 GA-binding protein subunit beta-2 [Colletotrichum fructicola]